MRDKQFKLTHAQFERVHHVMGYGPVIFKPKIDAELVNQGLLKFYDPVSGDRNLAVEHNPDNEMVKRMFVPENGCTNAEVIDVNDPLNTPFFAASDRYVGFALVRLAFQFDSLGIQYGRYLVEPGWYGMHESSESSGFYHFDKLNMPTNQPDPYGFFFKVDTPNADDYIREGKILFFNVRKAAYDNRPLLDQNRAVLRNRMLPLESKEDRDAQT